MIKDRGKTVAAMTAEVAATSETTLRQGFPLGDGFLLSPLLAKAAADLLVEGRTYMGMPADLFSLTRPSLKCLSSMKHEDRGSASGVLNTGKRGIEREVDMSSDARERMRCVDRWSDLEKLQDGSVYMYRSKEELEQEADEREDQRRAKAS
jgi:hypothetical protein